MGTLFEVLLVAGGFAIGHASHNWVERQRARLRRALFKPVLLKPYHPNPPQTGPQAGPQSGPNPTAQAGPQAGPQAEPPTRPQPVAAADGTLTQPERRAE